MSQGNTNHVFVSQYACNLHSQLNYLCKLQLSSMSLIRCLTILKLYHGTPSRLTVAASLLICTKLIESRTSTSEICASISHLTGLDRRDLESQQRTIISDVVLAPIDMVDHFQAFVSTTNLPPAQLIRYLAKLLGIVIALLIDGGRDPRENLVLEAIKMLGQLSVSNNITGLQNNCGEHIQLPWVFLSHERKHYASKSEIREGITVIQSLTVVSA